MQYYETKGLKFTYFQEKETKTMKMKEKAKEFYEKHEATIHFGASLLAVGAIGYCLGSCKYAEKWFVSNDSLEYTLKDAQNKYTKGMTLYTGGHASGLTPSDLGKLGEKMMLTGAEEGMKFTHFIAIGE